MTLHVALTDDDLAILNYALKLALTRAIENANFGLQERLKILINFVNEEIEGDQE